MASGAEPTQVMKMGGWADFKALQIYVRMAGVDVKGVTDNFFVFSVCYEFLYYLQKDGSVWLKLAIYAILSLRKGLDVVRKLKKEQGPRRNEERDVGTIIDCDEISISIFPPPREHGKPHCHVTSKKSCKVRNRKSEVYPEVKIFLDGSEVIIITEGFSEKDIQTIGKIIFNDPKTGKISNDEYLKKVWEELHGKSKEN